MAAKFTLDEWCETQKWLHGTPPHDWHTWASSGYHVEDFTTYQQTSNIGWKRTNDEWDECLMEWLLD